MILFFFSYATSQYCGMMGELATAVDLLKQALPLARTRDDVHDLNQVWCCVFVYVTVSCVWCVNVAWMYMCI